MRSDGAKRVLDVSVAALALGVLSPVLLLGAVAVRVSMGPPVLFRQVRPGRGGVPFRLYKLRTMREQPVDAPELPDAERLTRTGRFLRRTSVDELPQLWNVLRGDMSLVGPRPLLMEYLPLYSREQARRHDVRPGLTGWAQVNGRNAVDWPERLRMDVWYVDHASMTLDLRILWLTVKAVIARRGVSHGGDATMPRFRGT